MVTLLNPEHLANLPEDVWIDVPHDESEEEDFATWLDSGDSYSPATTLKPISKLPNGVYKMIMTQDGYKVVKVPLNSDELYTFSEGYTTTILQEVEDFWNRIDLYKKYNLSPKRGILLEGPPGSGKSSIITLLINQLIKEDGIVFLINDANDFNILANAMKPIVRKIEPDRRIITIIEDVDKLIESFGNNDSLILDFMDGKNSVDNHLIILTSNDTTSLSPALLRPSRIDRRYVLPNPSAKIRKEFFNKKGITDTDTYVKATDGMSFAELKEVFIGTQILGKDLNKVVDQILNPLETRDYFTTTKKKKIGL